MADATQNAGTSLYQHKAIRQVSDRGSRGSTPTHTPASSPEAPMSLASQFRLTCPKCLQDIKRPKQLDTCFHIFCAECLKEIIGDDESDTIKCPACSNRTTCPTDVAAWLDTDAYMHTLQGYVGVYAETGEVICKETLHREPVTAKYFCIECGKNFCDGCYDNHRRSEDFKKHHTLRLFATPATMTVAAGERQRTYKPSRDEPGANRFTDIQCPVCRDTAPCEHRLAITNLLEEDVRQKNECPIPSHVSTGNYKLIAYCEQCEEAICVNCSHIEHRDHSTVNIETARAERRERIEALKTALGVRQGIFHDAVARAEDEEFVFQEHLSDTIRNMIERKGKIQTGVEDAFNQAYTVIEQTGQKVVEINRQLSEMHAEDNFLQATAHLANLASSTHVTDVEMVRIWKGLQYIHDSMGGTPEKGKKQAKVEDAVVPQVIKEKRLVLPAVNCMTPDLSILRKVGVEREALELSFVLKLEAELLGCYSILPLTDTEALVACQPEACKSAVVGYDNLRHIQNQPYSSVVLKEEGQYCLVAVPGKGIVATHYQSAGACSSKTTQQVLFWKQALGCKMADLEKRGADMELLTSTDLPPRGIAVTKENNLVICMASDALGSSGDSPERKSSIQLMTLRGDVLKTTPAPVWGSSNQGQYFPGYVTVNINGDICVTDCQDHSILILDSQLKEKLRVRTPYNDANKTFKPMGICHDKFGRLIVADPDNHTVIRFEDKGDNTYEGHPILECNHGNAANMYFPKLVALGPGCKLWVVCRDRILVFDYMDEE